MLLAEIIKPLAGDDEPFAREQSRQCHLRVVGHVIGMDGFRMATPSAHRILGAPESAVGVHRGDKQARSGTHDPANVAQKRAGIGEVLYDFTGDHDVEGTRRDEFYGDLADIARVQMGDTTQGKDVKPRSVDVDAVKFTGHVTQPQMKQGAIRQTLRGVRRIGAAKVQNAFSFRSRQQMIHSLHEGNGRAHQRHATQW
jgi:hypothetical protein